MGAVAGMLSLVGAWIDDMNNADGIVEIKTRIPRGEVIRFLEWLSTETSGRGSAELHNLSE